MELRPVAYRTLAAQIRDAIRNGDYADGRQLPTEEQLAASYSVSRQTVRRAMQDLVSEGIIYRVAGRGTYPVAEQDRYVNHFGSVEELMALSLDTEAEVVSPLRRKVDVETASRLRLGSDEIFHVRLTGSVAAAEQSVSAAGAPAFAARHLGCETGEPLLRIDRLYFDAEDTPVELAISYFDPEHYSYRVKLRRRS